MREADRASGTAAPTATSADPETAAQAGARRGPPVSFGWVAAAAGRPGAGDDELYRDLLDDCVVNHGLGFEAAWVLEHHFSDYFPTPDPLLLLAYLSARAPDLALGTCVLVTPWHSPLRLAEQIASLSVLSERRLHLGLGRGTAKFEYDAFGLDMAEARGRFAETWEVLDSALSGDRFTYDGSFVRVSKEIRIRPRPHRERITFYGAIGSPESAGIIGSLGLPPICTSIGDVERQAATLSSWRAAAAEAGHPTEGVTFPLMINCIVAETDDEAVADAQRFMPRFMRAQVEHYTVHATDWEGTPGYEAWQRIFAGTVARQDPANIPAWTVWQLIGSPETVADRVRTFVDAGFNHLILHFATPGTPREDRRRWAERFAGEVAPRFR
jgi:alkanesulfonate monooxygenase SsuD/methylene tetrahydromethanopterin reductase-like flavin-dependent oxidoreductase (luciferase family)